MYLRDSSYRNRSVQLSSWCVCVCVCLCLCVSDCLCFQGWRILQKYFKALSMALFIGPENVLQQEGNKKEDRD